jgi:antitoxin FitA
MCQMCEEYEAELRRMGIIQKIVVDDQTMQRVEESAKRNGRSTEEEAAELLRQVVRPSRAEIVQRLKVVAAMTPKGVEQTDSTILIREDRDR